MHDLTEVDAFTTPVTVPDGIDSRNNAAEVVEAIAQALANRTKHLSLHAAFIDLVNTFTQANTFNALVTILDSIEAQGTDASIAALVTRKSADDDSHPGNLWKAVTGFQLGGGHGYVNMYTGTGTGGAGQFLIALNAVWDPATQLWSKDDSAVAAFGLIFTLAGTLTLSRRDGTGTWSTWPNPGSSSITAGSAGFTSLTTTNGIFSPAGTATLSDIQTATETATGLVTVGDLAYDPVKSIAGDALYLADAYGAVQASIIGGGCLILTGPAVSSVGYLPLKVPRGTDPGVLTLSFYQDSATPAQFGVSKRIVDYAGPGFSSLSSTGLVVSGPGSSGMHTVTLDLSSLAPMDPGVEYLIVWVPGANNDQWHGAKLAASTSAPGYGVGS